MRKNDFNTGITTFRLQICSHITLVYFHCIVTLTGFRFRENRSHEVQHLILPPIGEGPHKNYDRIESVLLFFSLQSALH